jgi:hypothetical protein
LLKAELDDGFVVGVVGKGRDIVGGGGIQYLIYGKLPQICYIRVA